MTNEIVRAIAFRDLKAKGVPYGRRELRELCRQGLFPAPIRLGPQRIGWIESEVDSWLLAQPRAASHAPRTGLAIADDLATQHANPAPQRRGQPAAAIQRHRMRGRQP